MDRREFIKLSGLAAVSLMTSSGLVGKFINKPPMIQLGDRLYKGAGDGKIVCSKNAGKTWQVHANFGQEVSLLDFSVNRMNRVVAQLSYKNYLFHLKLTADGNNWISA